MDDLVPTEFYLSQNYPNPFKDITTIKYCLPVKAKIKMTVFNSKNEKVRELVNTIQEAGTYQTKLESKDLPSGTYYYNMQALDPIKKHTQLFEDKKEIVLHH